MEPEQHLTEPFAAGRPQATSGEYTTFSETLQVLIYYASDNSLFANVTIPNSVVCGSLKPAQEDPGGEGFCFIPRREVEHELALQTE